jgi:hypothetical protein
LTQLEPLQRLSVPAHDAAHTPAPLQTVFGGMLQVLPQAPQFCGLLFSFTQKLKPIWVHSLSPLVMHAQTPLWQVCCPCAHVVPQAPQLFGSVCSLAQVPPHLFVPPGQDARHVAPAPAL